MQSIAELTARIERDSRSRDAAARRRLSADVRAAITLLDRATDLRPLATLAATLVDLSRLRRLIACPSSVLDRLMTAIRQWRLNPGHIPAARMAYPLQTAALFGETLFTDNLPTTHSV